MRRLEQTSGDKRISAGGRIRFGLVRSAARVPANVVVESMTRVRVDRWQVQRLSLFDDRPQGKFVELMKTSDRKTGKPRTMAFDSSGERVDPDAMMADILSARVKRFGKLDEDLDRVLRRASDDVVVMSHSVTDSAAAMTEFDTVAFYLSKNASSPNYDFIVTEVDVVRSGP